MFQRAYVLRAACAILLLALFALACSFSFDTAAAPTATAQPAIAAQPTTAPPTARPPAPTATAAPPATAASGTTATGSSGLITNVTLAQNVSPLSYAPIGAGDTFPPKATLQIVVAVSNAPKGTSVKSVLSALDIGSAAAPNTKLGEYTIDVEGTQNLVFSFEPTSKGFPVGTYKVDVLVNDKLDQTVNYSVKEGVAVVPTPAIKAVGSCPPLQGAPKPSDAVTKVSLAESVKSSDLSPVNLAQTFKSSSEVHAVVALNNAPANTAVKAVWYALDTGGAEACNTRIADYTIVADGSRNLDFTYKPPSKFPVGNYRVEIYVNDGLSHVADFNVK